MGSAEEARDGNDAALALRVAQTLLSREGTGPAWGVQVIAARTGYSLLEMTVRQDMTNGHGTAHGGMIFAIADTAFAYACNSRNAASVAQSASIIFLAPARVGEVLEAEAQEEAVGGRSGIYRVTVRVKGDQRVIAQFQGHSRTVGGEVIEAFK